MTSDCVHLAQNSIQALCSGPSESAPADQSRILVLHHNIKTLHTLKTSDHGEVVVLQLIRSQTHDRMCICQVYVNRSLAHHTVTTGFGLTSPKQKSYIDKLGLEL